MAKIGQKEYEFFSDKDFLYWPRPPPPLLTESKKKQFFMPPLNMKVSCIQNPSLCMGCCSTIGTSQLYLYLSLYLEPVIIQRVPGGGLHPLPPVDQVSSPEIGGNVSLHLARASHNLTHCVLEAKVIVSITGWSVGCSSSVAGGSKPLVTAPSSTDVCYRFGRLTRGKASVEIMMLVVRN